MKNNILIVGGYGTSYFQPFAKLGKPVFDIKETPIKFAIFTGGEDVCPKMYNEAVLPCSYFNLQRDLSEKAVFDTLRTQNIPMVGICRGAQFLCAMAGGKLYQHVENHTYWHEIITNDGRTIEVSSTHHQMQVPPLDAEIIAWSEKRSHVYLGRQEKWQGKYQMAKEADVVYYPNINALGIQYHPEMLEPNTAGFKYAKELVERYLLKQI